MNEENLTTQPENNSEGATLMSSEPEAPTGVEEQGEQQEPQAEQEQQAAESAAAEKPQGAPENYESFTPQEGREFDPTVIGKFSEAAKAANLTQEQAQTFLDTMAPALAERQTEQVNALKASWADAAKTDKEYGGEKLGENLSVAKKALDEFGSPELKSLLDDSGLGNHPEVIRFFYKAGKAISEDSYVGGKKTDGGVKDPAKVLYPDMA